MRDHETVKSAAEFLDSLADTLDGWAAQSRSGGWSTHQVQANRDKADDCRRKAAEIRRVIHLCEVSTP